MNKQTQRKQQNKPNFITLVKSYLVSHLQIFFYSLGQLWRAPLTTFMTCMVIAIALALPAGLHTLLQNTQQLSGSWESTTQISVFLKKNIYTNKAKALKNEIESWADVSSVEFISREQALKEFQQFSGFGDALQALTSNPLPSVLIVRPLLNNEQNAKNVAARLNNLKQADKVQLDMQWVKRLYALMAIIERGVEILSAFLALAVTLVIGNTIRLLIQNRRKEIVVMKLIGATNAFIRRPFLYTGFWYGLFGGVLAWLIVSFSLLSMSSPIEKLTALYQSDFELNNISFLTTLTLLSVSIFLGLLGSWITVGKHLHEIEPE